MVKGRYISSEAFQAPIHYLSTPRNSVHAKLYSTRHAGLWRYNYYNTTSATIHLRHHRSKPHRGYHRCPEARHADLETPGRVGPVAHKDTDVALVPRQVAFDIHVEV